MCVVAFALREATTNERVAIAVVGRRRRRCLVFGFAHTWIGVLSRRIYMGSVRANGEVSTDERCVNRGVCWRGLRLRGGCCVQQMVGIFNEQLQHWIILCKWSIVGHHLRTLGGSFERFSAGFYMTIIAASAVLYIDEKQTN